MSGETIELTIKCPKCDDFLGLSDYHLRELALRLVVPHSLVCPQCKKTFYIVKRDYYDEELNIFIERQIETKEGYHIYATRVIFPEDKSVPEDKGVIKISNPTIIIDGKELSKNKYLDDMKVSFNHKNANTALARKINE